MDIQQLYQIYQQHPVITTDSRDCPQGSIFFALKGESFDGNKFAASAIEKGCAYAVIDNAEYQKDDRFILVDDVLQTFKDLAREHRRQFNIPVIGITGTNGKTTTKELIASVLSEKYNTLFTQGNFNNDVGVPKTLFRLNEQHEIAVVEMGASHPGDIKTLVETVEPTCGLITNVGKAHLQGFGSFEGVKKTKGELYDYLKAHDALVFINGNNEHLLQMAQSRDICRAIEYGTQEDCQVNGSIISCAPFLKFQWNSNVDGINVQQEIQTHLIGSYNIDNMLAAIAIGLHFGVSPEQIHHALSNYIPTNNRSQMEETGKNHLVVDAYNANPSSMKAALDNFHLMEVSPKMAILGDMRELGEASAEEHQKAVDLMKEYGFENIWLVGDEFGNTQCNYRKFKDVEEVKAAIIAEDIKGFNILIKGSNSTKLWQLPPLL
ncbi:MAG: UDP-N-acetylmuramoyl-tripeptide--D-alanyl-D-alanine ligase [Prevotella sp.]|nr:UDP-N-acetylmuramoyl-tripeptide--D-alanyl-D-alanine ligase [Prevotella sp.]MBQ1588929.1 UDP-N-acetylmuramoyl-tripeptide--D-alanyl-D-alanine ligase [Prevotella sp.]MBQ1626676.1 UDP-N-acetylmuramoyl-tripeptide--D-alanyl-D-alanine ligase [Prevotella sp.]